MSDHPVSPAPQPWTEEMRESLRARFCALTYEARGGGQFSVRLSIPLNAERAILQWAELEHAEQAERIAALEAQLREAQQKVEGLRHAHDDLLTMFRFVEDQRDTLRATHERLVDLALKLDWAARMRQIGNEHLVDWKKVKDIANQIIALLRPAEAQTSGETR